MAILTEAAPQVPEARAPLQGRPRGTRTIEDLVEERLRKYPEPVRGGSLGVDIIRTDRHSR